MAGTFLYHGLTKFPALSGMAQMMGMPIFVLKGNGVNQAVTIAAA